MPDLLFRTFSAMDEFAAVPSAAALSSAMCVQSGVIVTLFGRSLESAVFVALGALLMVWVSAKIQAIPKNEDGSRRVSPREALLLLMLAILFSVAGLVRYLAKSEGTAAGGTPPRTAPADEQGKQPDHLLGGTYWGVILMTESAPHAVLVPPLPILKPDLFSGKTHVPLSIPFFGAYWMFRWPAHEPPPGSYRIRGSPLSSVFRSSDSIALSMEAHQNFGTLIDLRCCSRIELEARSADEVTILELILRNTSLADGPALSLGQTTIGSPGWHKKGDPPTPVVVGFDVPRNPRMRTFDEATIVFNRRYTRSSARVAIDRFVFVPRSM